MQHHAGQAAEPEEIPARIKRSNRIPEHLLGVTDWWRKLVWVPVQEMQREWRMDRWEIQSSAQAARANAAAEPAQEPISKSHKRKSCARTIREAKWRWKSTNRKSTPADPGANHRWNRRSTPSRPEAKVVQDFFVHLGRNRWAAAAGGERRRSSRRRESK